MPRAHAQHLSLIVVLRDSSVVVCFSSHVRLAWEQAWSHYKEMDFA